MNFEQLWAPWRLGYILGDKPQPEPVDTAALLPGAQPDCFLCRCAPAGDDRARLVIERTDRVVAVLNRYPYNNGHLLLAPLRHIGRLDGLRAEEHLALAETLSRLVNLLEKVMHPDGFNVGLNLGRAAGAGLPGHLHWHIVPRWIGDTNFVPITAAVRIIPQSLDAAWELLTTALQVPFNQQEQPDD